MFKRFAMAGIHFYRAYLSHLKPPTCRFYPTCSAYTMEAIDRHGVAGGVWRGIKRLARCHPWHSGGYDPVDEA